MSEEVDAMSLQEEVTRESRTRRPDALSRPERDKMRRARPRSAGAREDQLLRAMGWVGIVIGVAGLALPPLERLFGKKRRALFGLLPKSRVRSGGKAAAAVAVSGVTILTLLQSQSRAAIAEPMEVAQALTIGKTPDELSRILHDPDTLPLIMEHFADVTSRGNGHTHWIVRGMRSTLEWDARIVEHRPGESIRWVSVPGSPVHVEVSMRFRPAPDGWGTEVYMRLSFDPPSRVLRSITRALGILPNALATKALHRFKSLVETGEIPTIRYQPAARNGGRDL
jgi:uncharacterized membrane protein